MRGKLVGHKRPIMDIVFTGIAVWTASRDGNIVIWEPDSELYKKIFDWNPMYTNSICMSCMAYVGAIDANQKNCVWIGSGAEGKITVWDTAVSIIKILFYYFLLIIFILVFSMYRNNN